jgi:hypothetical protein
MSNWTFDWSIVSDMWKSIAFRPVGVKVALDSQQIERVDRLLESVRPVISFMVDPSKVQVSGLGVYIFTVLSILGLSGLIFGRVWRHKGSLNQFIAEQHKKLLHWVRQKYVTITKHKVQRDIERHRRRAKERENQQAQLQPEKSYWETLKDTVSSVGPHKIIRSLLDPENKTSWALLGSMWVQYMTGTHVPYVGSQLPFGAVVTASAAKLLVFIFYHAKKLIRQEFYGVDYDPFFIRIPVEILTAFLNLLHQRLDNKRLTALDGTSKADLDSTDAEMERLYKEIKDLERTRDLLKTNLQDLSSADLNILKSDPEKITQRIEEKKAVQGELESRLTQVTTELKKYIAGVSTKPNISSLHTTQIMGIMETPGLIRNWNKSVDTIYLDTWITVAQYIINFQSTQKSVVSDLIRLGEANDTGNKYDKYAEWTFSSSPWQLFESEVNRGGKILEKQRTNLADIRKFIVINLLRPSERIVTKITNLKHTENDSNELLLGVPTKILEFIREKSTLQLDNIDEKIPWEWFISDKDAESLKTLNQNSVLPSEILPLEEKNQWIMQFLDRANQLLGSIKSQTKHRRDVYVTHLFYIYQRHVENILLCKAMCTLLKFLISCKDALDVSVLLYEKNKTLTGSVTIDNVLNIYDHLSDSSNSSHSLPSGIEIKDSDDNNTFKESLQISYGKVNTYETLHRRIIHVTTHMCYVCDLCLKLDNPADAFHKDDMKERDDIKTIQTLYNVPIEKCPERSDQMCQECVCDEVDSSSPIILPPRNPKGSQIGNISTYEK